MGLTRPTEVGDRAPALASPAGCALVQGMLCTSVNAAVLHYTTNQTNPLRSLQSTTPAAAAGRRRSCGGQ